MSHRTHVALSFALAGALAAGALSAPAALAAETAVAAHQGNVRASAFVSPIRDVPTQHLRLWPGSTALVPGQAVMFEALSDTSPVDHSELTWTSSDTSILAVDDKGFVTAIGEGEATISVKRRAEPTDVSAVPVRVHAVSEEAGIELSASSMVSTVGRPMFLNALLAPSLRGSRVEWALSSASLGSIAPDEGEPTAIFTPSMQAGVGTLTATVTTPAGVVKTVTVTVDVLADDTGDFVMDDSGVLIAYRGVDAEVDIPAGVTAIDSRAFSDTTLRTVRIPASVRRIDDEAFYGTSLEEITFQDDEAAPSELAELGSRVFSNTNVQTLTLPRSLVTINRDAFADMSKLTSVHLGPKVAADQLVGSFANTPELTRIQVDAGNPNYESLDGVLYTRDHTHLIAYPAAKNAGGAYTVASGTTDIDDLAFLGAQVESVTFPDTLRRVGDQSFEGAALTTLTLPDGFETMGASAFWQMPALVSVDLGGATGVSTNAFRYDAALSEVTFRHDLGRLTSIGEGAFVGISATTITIPDTVSTIAEEAFSKNPALISFHVGASLNSLGDYALGENDNLATLSVSPANASFVVDDGALYHNDSSVRTLVRYAPASSDSEATVAAGTTAVGAGAFENATSLRRVILPEGLTTIGDEAFDGCANLVDMAIPASVEVARGLTSTGLDTIELGTQVRDLSLTPRGARSVRHLIVRGGVDGTFYSEGTSEGGRPESAFFGEGMTSFTFWGEMPRVLVLPATATKVALAEGMAPELKADTSIYVASAEGTSAWTIATAAMESAGYDASRLSVYEAPTLGVSGTGIAEAEVGYALTVSPGVPATVEIAAGGGVATGREARVVRVGANTTETLLQDWTAMTDVAEEKASTLTYTFTPSLADSELRVDVRDASGIRQSVTVSVTVNRVLPPLPLPDPNDDPAPAPVEDPDHAGAKPSPVTDDDPKPAPAPSQPPVPAPSQAPGPAPSQPPVPVPSQAPGPAPIQTSISQQQTGEWVWGARGWWYRYADGSYPVGTAVTIGGRVYRFDVAGYMRVGWVRDNGAWYYHLRSGVQASGWVSSGGSWYYLTPGSGAMSTGWVSDGWAWYRFADSGQWVE